MENSDGLRRRITEESKFLGVVYGDTNLSPAEVFFSDLAAEIIRLKKDDEPQLYSAAIEGNDVMVLLMNDHIPGSSLEPDSGNTRIIINRILRNDESEESSIEIEDYVVSMFDQTIVRHVSVVECSENGDQWQLHKNAGPILIKSQDDSTVVGMHANIGYEHGKRLSLPLINGDAKTVTDLLSFLQNVSAGWHDDETTLNFHIYSLGVAQE